MWVVTKIDSGSVTETEFITFMTLSDAEEYFQKEIETLKNLCKERVLDWTTHKTKFNEENGLVQFIHEDGTETNMWDESEHSCYFSGEVIGDDVCVTLWNVKKCLYNRGEEFNSLKFVNGILDNTEDDGYRYKYDYENNILLSECNGDDSDFGSVEILPERDKEKYFHILTDIFNVEWNAAWKCLEKIQFVEEP